MFRITYYTIHFFPSVNKGKDPSKRHLLIFVYIETKSTVLKVLTILLNVKNFETKKE